MNNSISTIVVALAVAFCGCKSYKNNYNSYHGLVMVGYQGWFNAEGDGANRGFYHYKGNHGFRPGSATVDMWPDVSEYERTYPTAFTMPDGLPARVFSSYDSCTVDTHFKWMKDYGLDGVFMQRFVSEIKGKSGKCHFDKVLASAMSSSNKYDRAICVMYDLSGMKAGDESFVLDDAAEWSALYKVFDHRKNPSYLYHNGKPLVAVWGVGFNDSRDYALGNCDSLIAGLKKMGFSIMIGVPTYWRELKDDTTDDSRLHDIIKDCDIVMPWFVTRYTPETFDGFKKIIPADMEWCKRAGLDYVPLVFPGFSWRNMYGEDTTFIPRQRGKFLQMQIDNAIECGATMLYVAMFDEIDEGTAIFKCATEVPVESEGTRFIPVESGLGSDYYLKIVGGASKRLR